jgi:hypothetical protein
MNTRTFPAMDTPSFGDTHGALQAYASVLGAWLKTCRSRRKHWWHASLRPSIGGLSSGVIHSTVDIELVLNLRESLFQARTSTGEQLDEALRGQPAAELAAIIQDFMIDAGVDVSCIPQGVTFNTQAFGGYSAEQASELGRTLNAVSAAMAAFRAPIREETSPIQLWPHHFDLSMLWLPGEKIPGQDPENEEYADKQMNFGFAFGDESIPEPYFYVTAYPLPEALPKVQLPEGTRWQSTGFNGAVLLYQDLLKNSDPMDYLIGLWTQLLDAGRKHMIDSVT